MRKIFKTHINLGSYIWGLAMIIFIVMLSYEGLKKGLYLGTLLLFGVFAITWYFTFFYKRYWIEGDKLFIKTVSGTKTVDITSIRKLETDKVDWFGTMRLTILRPYRKGMVLHYNKIDDIFVDPENPTEFIDKLKQITPNIDVIASK
ncbi:PH domain-containing protein [Sphingobacterium multivorum]|uniref:PH domain-containing protein n=1 Tax=Sphingobacterium multivorum TaxID=28454 RepID=UPI00345E5C5A